MKRILHKGDARKCLTFFTIFSFSLPGSSQDYDFVGFARAINLGIEYKGGTVNEYSVASKNTSSNIQSGIGYHADRIKYLLNNTGYDTNVYLNGNDIVVEFFDEYSPEAIEDIINNKASFAIKTEQSDTAEEVIKPEHISKAYATTSGSQKVLLIEFTSAGAEKFSTVIESGTAYFYFDESFGFQLSVSNSNKNYVGIVLNNLETAKNYASKIMASKYDFTFEEINSTVYTKADANRNVITLIALAVGLFVLFAIIFIGLFKLLGLVGAFTLFIGLLLQILLLQAVPETAFTFTGVALYASLLAMAIGALAIFVMYNNMHKEYKQGKILNASVKFGYQKSWAKLLDLFVILEIPTIMAYFFGSYLVKQFAMAFMCGLLVYGFVALLFTKFFTKWLTYIAFKNKQYGFKREAHVDELK